MKATERFIIIFALLVSLINCLLIIEIMKKNKENDDVIHFVWNDDIESIPADGELIKIKYTDENTVYIGPISNNK